VIGLLSSTHVATVTVSDVTTRFSTIFMLTAGLRWQDTDKREERLDGDISPNFDKVLSRNVDVFNVNSIYGYQVAAMLLCHRQ
jgi:hypothetical protein